MKRGRKKLTAYEKYVRSFNKEKGNKSDWYDSAILSEQEWKINTRDRYPGLERDKLVKEIIHQQKFGYGLNELAGRKAFYEADLKGKVKWTTLKNMTHEEFVDEYGDYLSQMYEELQADPQLGKRGAQLLISAYVFGSD